MKMSAPNTRVEDVVAPTNVAIIGLACRFPGAANPAEFWQLMCDGVEVMRLPGDVGDFDADFFNLSPRA
jgi:acyl transferase domain-containing protein